MENIAALPQPATTEREASRRAPALNPWPDRVALALVYLVSIGSLVGFATFSLNPQLLNQVPGAAAVYAQMFVLAPRVQIILAFAAIALFLARRAGAQWLPAFAALYVLSLASELAGTTVGLPFGPYSYTDGLGTKLFAHVPILIPVSWFFMALPSYAIARRRFPEQARLGRRIVVASLILLSWDLALDPAMSMVTKYWVWGTAGPYYGMPLLNLFGWYVTGVVLMAALAYMSSDRWIARLPVGWLVGFYGANLILPFGMNVAAGLWGAAAATIAALVACWLLTRTAAPTATVAARPGRTS